MRYVWEMIVDAVTVIGVVFGGFFGFVLIACLFGFIFSLVGGTIFYFLWNWLAPIVWAAAPVLNWLQAVGIWFLLGMVGQLIFGSRSGN